MIIIDWIMLIIEWIVDFFEFFGGIILLGAAIALYDFFLKGGFRRRKNKQQNQNGYYDEQDDDHPFHQQNQDPDFSYMSHDAPEEQERDLLRDGWNGEQLDPTNPDHYAVYDMYDNK